MKLHHIMCCLAGMKRSLRFCILPHMFYKSLPCTLSYLTCFHVLLASFYTEAICHISLTNQNILMRDQVFWRLENMAYQKMSPCSSRTRGLESMWKGIVEFRLSMRLVKKQSRQYEVDKHEYKH